MRFKLQNRYQDSGWENLNESFHTTEEAEDKALEFSKNSICYGMVRVVDTSKQEVVSTFSGGKQC